MPVDLSSLIPSDSGSDYGSDSEPMMARMSGAMSGAMTKMSETMGMHHTHEYMPTLVGLCTLMSLVFLIWVLLWTFSPGWVKYSHDDPRNKKRQTDPVKVLGWTLVWTLGIGLVLLGLGYWHMTKQ